MTSATATSPPSRNASSGEITEPPSRSYRRLFGLAYSVVIMLISPQTAALFELPEPSTATIVGAFALFVVAGTLFSGFLTTYAVAFYRELVEAENRTL